MAAVDRVLERSVGRNFEKAAMADEPQWPVVPRQQQSAGITIVIETPSASVASAQSAAGDRRGAGSASLDAANCYAER
jgi:hypothetical protein